MAETDPGPDPALLARLLVDEGVVTDPGTPGWREWIAANVAEAWHQLVDGWELDAATGWIMLSALALITVGLFGGVGWLTLRASRRQASSRVTPGPVPVAPGVDRIDQVEALLAANRCREAARVVWITTTEGLAAAGIGEVHADQTHGEYVWTVERRNPGWARHATLRTLRRQADQLCYAPLAPTPDGVRTWMVEMITLRTQAGA